MHPELSQFPSKYFYNNRLKDGPDMASKRTEEWHQHNIFKPYKVFDIVGREESKSFSYFNPAEIDICVDLVKLLCSSFPQIQFSNRIGIITFYKQQVHKLRDRFCREFGGTKILQSIDINTVDGVIYMIF